jgi:hypothetical protein
MGEGLKGYARLRSALTPEDAGKLFPVIWETVAKD